MTSATIQWDELEATFFSELRSSISKNVRSVVFHYRAILIASCTYSSCKIEQQVHGHSFLCLLFYVDLQVYFSDYCGLCAFDQCANVKLKMGLSKIKNSPVWHPESMCVILRNKDNFSSA